MTQENKGATAQVQPGTPPVAQKREITEEEYIAWQEQRGKLAKKKAKSEAKRKAIADLKKKFKGEYEASIKRHGG